MAGWTEAEDMKMEMVPTAPGEVGYSSDREGELVGTVHPDGSHPEARLSKRLYREYSSSQQKWAKQAAEDLKVYNGVHWTTEQKAVLAERGQQPIAIQTMYQIVDQAVGMLSANNPRFNAAAREDSDVKDAAFVRHVLQWGWQQNRGNGRFKAALRDYYVQGRGAMYIYIDPNKDLGKGEVCFLDLDPKEVFPDPNSRDPLLDDAAHVMVRRILTEEQIRIMWPHFDLENVKQEDGYPYSTSMREAHNDEQIFPEDINEQEHRKYEAIERFTKIKLTHYRLFNPHTGREDILDEKKYQARLLDPAFIVVERGIERLVIDPKAIPELTQLYVTYGEVSHLIEVPGEIDPQSGVAIPEVVRIPGPAGEDAIPGSELLLTPTTVGELVRLGALPVRPFLMDRIKVVATIGDKLLYDPFVLRTSHYPVVVFPNSHNRNPYPISDVHRTRDLQDMINKTNSLILAHAANVTNQKVWVPIGAGGDVDHLEQEWGKAGTAILFYDPQFGIPIFGTPPPLPNELYHNVDRAIQLMERIMGVFSVMQGDPSAAPQTFKGTMAIDEFGARRMKSKVDDLYVCLARLGQVWFELAQNLYTEEKMIRLVEPDGSIEEAVINTMQYDSFMQPIGRINDITVGHYDIMIQAGSTLPSNRWAMLAEYKELFQLGLVDQVSVLKRAEIPDADQILERSGMMQQMQAMIQQQEETIKKLKGDLQTAEREEVTARQKAELEKFKANLKGTEADYRKSAQVFDIALQKEREKQIAIANEVRKNTNQQLVA